MRPPLADRPVMKDEDLVRVDDCTQSVRDGHRRSAAGQLAKGALYLGFDLAVHGARCFVQHEELGIRGDGTRE